jgi:signal transduction histidine kinase
VPGTAHQVVERARGRGGLTFAAAVAGLSELAFHTERPLTYVVFPALMLAALRFGLRGATLAVAVTVGFAVWNTTHYEGPFVYSSVTHSVLSTQLFIAVAALSALCLAAVVSEREEFAARLGASRGRLIKASDIERRRLEHNLHDGAQQRLTTLLYALQVSAERARQAPERAVPGFEEAGSELSLAIEELRELAHGIHPSVLTDLGLASAIHGLARRSPVPIALVALPSGRLDATAEATAYYVAAEAVTNAHRHAHASSIEIRAAMVRGRLRLEISDDGVGGAAEAAGFGLQGLRDRVEAIGGTFDVDSPVGQGTRIAAAMPAASAAF